MTRIKNGDYWFLITTILVISMCLSSSSSAFQSDELLLDDEEFGLEGARSPPDLQLTTPTRSIPPPTVTPSQPTSPARTKSSDTGPDSKVQFPLEHAFGDSDFSPAGTFTARLKTWSHGGQTLTKLRFSREAFTEIEKEKFKKLLEGDNFYRIRVPSNVLSPPGRDYIISSVKARCLPQDRLDEHFVIHVDGVNILAVNYGSPGACPYPRQLKLAAAVNTSPRGKKLTQLAKLKCLESASGLLGAYISLISLFLENMPAKWSFNSHTVLKNSEQAPRIVTFVDEILGGEIGEGEVVKPPERSFWAKYWMYLIPLGIIVMNAITQAMNMPEEQATSGQSASQIPQQTTAAIRGGQTVAVRRR